MIRTKTVLLLASIALALAVAVPIVHVWLDTNAAERLPADSTVPVAARKAEPDASAGGKRDAVRCDEPHVCIEPVDDESRTEFFVRNLSVAPVTVTLRVRAGGSRRTLTATLEPDSRELFMSIYSNDRYSFDFAWTIGRQNAHHDDSVIYRLPYEPGTAYRVLQGFGSRFSHTGHERYAVDFAMDVGTPVHAARDGLVARVVEHNDKGCWEDGCGKFANFIVVLHDDGTTGEYYHLQQSGSLVEEGERVEAGQHIGYSGNTGHSTMPHLHFAVYRASSWGSTKSLPVKFAARRGIIDGPRRGVRYTATP